MQVVIPDNREKAALLVARFITRKLKGNPQVVLGLATGRTMEAFYRNLVEIHQKKAALPDSALQMHPNCIVIADEEAASQLQSKDDFKWIFENDPEWEEFRVK